MKFHHDTLTTLLYNIMFVVYIVELPEEVFIFMNLWRKIYNLYIQLNAKF